MYSALEEALAAQAPYDSLNPALQQQFTLPEYRSRSVVYCVSRGDCYDELPLFVRNVLTLKRYAELAVSISLDRLQLYPYRMLHAVVEHTRETPLTFYSQMLALLLKGEKSYDALPNFTAVDILNLLGVGRNQFLNLTKEARGKLWWRVTRSSSLIRELLPKELLPTASLDPFWEVWLVDPTTSTTLSATPSGYDMAKKVCEKDEVLLAVWKRMQQRWKTNGAAYSTESMLASGSAAVNSRRASVSGGSSRSVKALPATPQRSTGLETPPGRDTALQAADEPDDGKRGLTSPAPSPLPVSASSSLLCPVPPRPFFYACELPKAALHTLYRKGLVYPVFYVDPRERIVIPPLENFVMNRTSDDPQESSLYKILGTIDDHTSMDLLAQLLSMDVDRVCFAAEMFVRLGLAHRVTPANVPLELVSQIAVLKGWGANSESPLLVDPGRAFDDVGTVDSPAPQTTMTTPKSGATSNSSFGAAAASAASRWCVLEDDFSTWGDSVEDAVRLRFDECTNQQQAEQLRLTEGRGASPANACGDDVVVVPPDRNDKRMALLYDASLTGFLMMSNLSTDPTFKQHAVTLFEAGKLTDEVLQGFHEKLVGLDDAERSKNAQTEEEDSFGGGGGATSSPSTIMMGDSSTESFGGEARKYLDSVICLGKVLTLLRGLNNGISSDMKSHLGHGVDMRKIESLNDLEAKTRYLVLGRKYLSFFSLSPITCPPLLDLEVENIYGPSVALFPSPWMVCALSRDIGLGCPSVLFPFGTRILRLRPSYVLEPSRGHTVRLRVQPLGLETEVAYCNPHTCLMILNSMTCSAPVFVQRVAEIPRLRKADGFFEDHPAYMVLEVSLPFTASDDEVSLIALEQIAVAATRHRRQFFSASGATNANATAMGPQSAVEFSNTHTLQLTTLFRRLVDKTELQHSIGYASFSITVMDAAIAKSVPIHHATSANHHGRVASLTMPKANISSPTAVPHDDDPTSMRIVAASLIDIGFGFPIDRRSCCEWLIRHVPERVLANADQIAHHNLAVKRLSASALSLMRQVEQSVPRPYHDEENGDSVTTAAPPTAADETIRRLGLGGAEESGGAPHVGRRGPSTMRHLRSLGSNYNAGCPFPQAEVSFFDGKILIKDAWDPLTE